MEGWEVLQLAERTGGWVGGLVFWSRARSVREGRSGGAGGGLFSASCTEWVFRRVVLVFARSGTAS